MRLSSFYLPTLKETPKEAEIVSHRLMLRAGMVRQMAAGIYSWLPLGLRVLRKVEEIVRQEQDRAGCQEMLMPTLQPAELWQRSGRYDDYGPEMLRITDRHDRGLVYGPTNEEMLTDIIASTLRSYRDLPKALYHIQWKFRDEVRPRFGVMRGREFLMKDCYSFDLDKEAARHSYNKMFVAYLKTFKRMGLDAIPMEADTGPIGGDLSHEFIVLAETGESVVFWDADFKPMDLEVIDYDDHEKLDAVVQGCMQFYARTEDRHDPAAFEAQVPKSRRRRGRGIEVGQLFYFGTKYSEPLGAKVTGPEGEEITVEMGSYGIGVSRLVGAIIEASHDSGGIIWPDSVAPFDLALINLRAGDADCDAACEDIHGKLLAAGADVLYDDRNERPGVKFADADLVGLPWRLVIGPRGLKEGKVELKRRDGSVDDDVTLDQALARLTDAVAG
ncbi:MAG: proline--tRNA ligase [Alphaproteobacteria bacterium]|nr:proline--tRNA ligase [Alphaproteobacteria bacterium]